jgi:hypothetical protein
MTLLSCSQKTHKTKIDTLPTIRYASLYGIYFQPLHYPHSNSTSIMLRCCIVCLAEELPDLQLQYCAICQSALYCSKACQKKDWKKQHKQICKLLNVGHGDMQLRTDTHTRRSIAFKVAFDIGERRLDEDMKRFFKLFEESTFEGSQAAARKMKKIVKRQTKRNQKFLLFHSLYFLVRSSDSEKLSWLNSPLLVLLQSVDLNMVTGDEDTPLPEGEDRETPLQHLANLADPHEYSTHENQLILAKQLVEHGANVNAASSPHQGKTPLNSACYGGSVTNLDFVELLLKEGADPNRDHRGLTALLWTIPDAPGAAKFLLNWPTTDVNITTRSGASLLATVRRYIDAYTAEISLRDDPDQVQDQFKLHQWREVEEMLVERGAHDTGITGMLL